MREPAGESEDKSPDLPPPGWYANPSGAEGIRWWNGLSWAPTTAAPPKNLIRKKRLRPAGVWFTDSIRVCSSAKAELFSIVAVLILPAFLGLAGVSWYALREAALLVTVEADGQTSSIETRGGQEFSQGVPWILLAFASIGLASFILSQASSIHAVQTEASRPATWLASLRLLLSRLRSVVPVAMLYAAVWAYLALLLVGVEVSAVLLLVWPLLLALIMLLAWTRFAFSGAAAAVGPSGKSAFRQSFRASKGRQFEVFGRFLFLGSWTFIGSVFFLFMARLILAGSADDPLLPGSTDTSLYSFTGAFGNNIYLYFLITLLAGLFWGAVVVVWSSAAALLYKELGGEVEVENFPLVVPEPASPQT